MFNMTHNPNQISDIAIQLEEILELDDLEAGVYLTMLRSGPITASALAKEIHIDRTRMYRIVERLVNRNMISTTLSNPKLCIAINPHEALKNALSKKEDEVNKIKKSSQAIINKINKEIRINQVSLIPTFRVVQGRQNIYSDIAQLIEETTDIIYIVTTLDDISKMYHSTIIEQISSCEKNGGRVRLIVDIDDPTKLSYVKRFNATETRIGKLPSKGRMIVQKDKKMIMSHSIYSSLKYTNSELDFSLYTNSLEMITNIFAFCSFLWDSAKPLTTIELQNYTKNKI